MSRNALIVICGIAAIVGVAFGFYPELDLHISAPFQAIMFWTPKGEYPFGLRFNPLLQNLRDVGLWIPFLLVAPAFIAIGGKIVVPRKRMLMSGRASLFLIVTLAIGPGLITNVILKEHWNRPRPVDVTTFGGTQDFVAWWDPRGTCDTNCSFVSGDSAGAFWTVAPAALMPPQYRAVAYTAAIVFGAAISLQRLAFGAHSFTDVFFAGFFTFIVIWVCYALIYRWRRTRLTDEEVEGVLARFSLALGERRAALLHRIRDRRRGDAR
ncbi:MAG TPA: phosphatase PAP2 family protein [Xanthobacteraceae bacterium]|jgi:lipid A 4'-phosphatase|nr:phosphatase PAP2 family protein [Xanthobacteraceae bacterium]